MFASINPLQFIIIANYEYYCEKNYFNIDFLLETGFSSPKNASNL